MKKLVKIGALVLVVVFVIFFATEKKQPISYDPPSFFILPVQFYAKGLEEFTNGQVEEAPYRLPVYIDLQKAPGRYTNKEMQKTAEQYCQKLGWQIVQKGTIHDTYAEYSIECEEGRITANSGGGVWIMGEMPLSLFGCKEDEDILSCLRKMQRMFTAYSHPKEAFNSWRTKNGTRHTHYIFYEGAASSGQDLLNRYKSQIYFRLDSDESTRMIYHIVLSVRDKVQLVDNYRTITKDQAKEVLLKEDNFTVAKIEEKYDFTIKEEMIEKVEVVYDTETFHFKDWILPYYRFYIRLPDNDSIIAGINAYVAIDVMALMVNEQGVIDK